MRRLLVTLPLAVAAGLLGAFQDEPPGEVPARALSRELCAQPRLAGTHDSLHATSFVADRLREAGFEVELDERIVLLSFPRRIEIAARTPDGELFHRVETFDPRAVPAGDVPKYSAWSKSGSIESVVVDVGRGLREDYEALVAQGVSVEGKIALARYGGAYRGVKADLAARHGAAGCLLFSEPSEDGARRGPTWPAGRWKPGWAAQRGSISPLATSPGDPSTPGWPSPRPGEKSRRLDPAEADATLPTIPCLPIGADEALALIAAGPEATVTLDLDMPRELFRIVNVIGRLPGTTDDFVVAGNHRDAWVRGAHDAGSGTVALLRAAQTLGERARAGWKPRNGIVVGFWDAEEFGLIGSTEWGEAHGTELRRHAIAYVNADAAVAGLSFGASGTPGLSSALRRALERVPSPLDEAGNADERNLWQDWTGGGTEVVDLGLPGSGSDFTVFLHHLGVPVLDISFRGNQGGHYHTAFDDFSFMDRFLDPTWRGHETAGATLAAILTELAEGGHGSFDHAEAARAMGRVVEKEGKRTWLGAERAKRLAAAFERLARTIESSPEEPRAAFYQALESPTGLPGRSWYKNRLWAPGLETGYSAETLPSLRAAAADGETALERELVDLIAAVRRLESAWLAEGTGEVQGGAR